MSVKTVLCYSGGLDSTVLLYKLLKEGHEVRCLIVDYGQRHHKEVDHANSLLINDRRIRAYRILDLIGISEILQGSSQTDVSVPVPEGHYTEESMKATVVPNRNMILLSLATAWAISTKSTQVAYAAHAGDHTIYPDCREVFITYLGLAVKLCDWNPPELYTPFLKKSKADIVSLGHSLGVPFEKTWSCYKGREKHCGKCGTCVERKEAFEIAKVVDPTEYE